MSNTWKARCVDSEDSSWLTGEIVEVIDGTALKGESHGWGGVNNKHTQSFENWRKYQDGSRWELISEKKPTLRDHINQMSNRELAEMIVEEESYDYNWEEELIYDGIEYSYITTDKQEFCDREDAVEHQIKLLEGEYNG